MGMSMGVGVSNSNNFGNFVYANHQGQLVMVP